MRHERPEDEPHAALTRALARLAEDADRTASFPAASFDRLRDAGIVAAPPIGADDIGGLLRLLAAVGRGDLSVGRIFEGHVNALLLIRAFGTLDQRRRYEAIALDGGLFGVWNTDLPDDPLRLDGTRLAGRKSFASGVDGLSHAIVTVGSLEGRRMIVAPIEGRPVDRSWWRPLGMRASGSHLVDFGGLDVEADWLLGGPDDYIREPWFSGGAIRFVAVQTGGMHAVFDVVLSHLRRTRRDGDPHQRQRLARIGIAVETAYGWLDRAASDWIAAAEDGASAAAGDRLVATVNAARSAVEASALAVLEDAERGVGAAGFIAPHPLERLVRDLRTYLRQPNPDGALASLGASIASGLWTPGRPHDR